MPPPKLLPAIVLVGFCGLRSGEILSLDWSSIDFVNMTVVIEGGMKTFHRRVVPLPDAAAAWLTPIAKDSGRVVHHRSLRTLFSATDQVWKSSGVKRSPNILRLSMMSYRFAATDNASKTASELGTSPQLLEIHHLKSISNRDAEAWFGIFPK